MAYLKFKVSDVFAMSALILCVVSMSFIGISASTETTCSYSDYIAWGIVAGCAAAHGSGIGAVRSVKPAGTLVFTGIVSGCASDGATCRQQPSATCSLVGYPLLMHDATSARTYGNE